MKRGVVLLLASAIALGSGVAQARREYTIETGDTTDGIRLKFAPTLKALEVANPSINFSTLPVGKTIKDPLYEEADVATFKQKITTLEKDVAEASRTRDDFRSQLAVAETRVGELEGEIAELESLAQKAEYYRDRFVGWMQAAGVMITALAWFWWRRRRAYKIACGERNSLQTQAATYRNMLTKAGVPLDMVGPEPKVTTTQITTGQTASGKKVTSIGRA